ncbi:hypothetical protein KY319_01520 [Candidatus Woesearchaeota archaeon]|nr:hypothetical protein [Candidatus Woesearchaeota archaeon]
MKDNEQSCEVSIKDLKPALPETVYNCKGCPIEKGSTSCYHQMYHSDRHCQKYFSKNESK